MFTSVDDTLLRADALTLLCCRDADLEKDNAALSKQCRALLSVVRVTQLFFRERKAHSVETLRARWES